MSHIGLILAAELYGCGHVVKPVDVPPETRVAYRASIAPDASRYEVKEDEVANSPVPIKNPAPLYPADVIAQGLPLVVVAAKVIVDRDGNVGEVRIVPSADGARPAAFDAVVREALSQWRFAPLTFTRWEEVKDEQGNVVDSRQASVERRPFSLDYEFRFELRGGKPAVDAVPTISARRD